MWWIVKEIMKTLLIMYYSVHVSFCDQVLCLASVGGRKVKPHIKAILGTIWATPLARQFNFCGLKGKRSFKDLKCLLRTIQGKLCFPHVRMVVDVCLM